MYFQYGDRETEYLKKKDKVLGAAIEKIGHIEREVDRDLFSSVIHHIIGQQISTKAQATIWRRMVYHHRKIDRKLFEKYRRRFSPYCSVASLYFWAVAGGAVPGMRDYAPKKGRK